VLTKVGSCHGDHVSNNRTPSNVVGTQYAISLVQSSTTGTGPAAPIIRVKTAMPRYDLTQGPDLHLATSTCA
jgi:hypothetical protein